LFLILKLYFLKKEFRIYSFPRIHDKIIFLNFCFRPFTTRPKSSNALIPKERPSAKKPVNSIPSKPWTHSSASSNRAKARPPSEKQAPHPQTPDTTIEQAAIWV